MRVGPENVTIYEVAQAAGVSISTVSNALNRPDRVSGATRSRVLEVAHALGYVPKAEAVSFARKAMRRIGVLGALHRLRVLPSPAERHPQRGAGARHRGVGFRP